MNRVALPAGRGRSETKISIEQQLLLVNLIIYLKRCDYNDAETPSPDRSGNKLMCPPRRMLMC